MPAVQSVEENCLTGLELWGRIQSGAIPFSPYAAAAGLGITELEDGRAVIEATPGAAHMNQVGMVHGGWVATVMDVALGVAAQTGMPAGERAITIEMKVNLTRAITPGSTVRATAEVVHGGRRTVVVEGRLLDPQGRVAAIALGTFAVVEVPTS